MKIVCLLLVSCALCVAQAPDPIGYIGFFSQEHGLYVRANESMSLQVFDVHSQQSRSGVFVSTVAALRVLEVVVTSYSSFLVTWLATSGAVVAEEFIFSQGAWSATQVASGFIAGLSVDHLLAYDELRGELIVLDNDAGSLWGGIWQVGAPLSAVSWLNFANVTTEPILNALRRIVPSFLWIDDAIDPTGRALRLSQHPWGASAHLYRLGMIIRGSILAPSFSALPGDDRWIEQAPPVFDGASLVEGSSVVTVSAYPGRAFEVTDEAGIVVGTGVNNSPVTQDVIVPISRILDVGQIYGVRYAGSQVSEFGSVYRAYGIPGCSPTSGLCFQAHHQNLSLKVGNEMFRFRFALVDSTPSGIWTSLSGVALAGIAAGSATGNDPVLFAGPHAVLDPVATVLLPVTVSVDENGYGQVLIDSPIPNDPLLAGAILLFQAAIDDGGGVLLSQVIGQMVAP